MNFLSVTERLLFRFGEHRIAYALIGGYAVGLWGVPRGTVDLDFLVLRDDMPKVSEIVARLGYDVRFASENVTQFVSSSATLGEIDFLHAFRAPSVRMLERAVEKPIFDNKLKVKVLLPEDLIGLKVQAFSNDERREHLDLYDIETLMKLHGGKMDWELIAEYFAIFELSELFEKLKGKYHV